MTRIFAALAAVALLALLGGLYVLSTGGTGDDRFAQCRAAKVAGGGGEIGGPFTLIDETGRTVTSEEVIDKPTLIYFGYTFCPDICPFDAARNAEAVELLEERGKMVKPVFISVDPDRDTPEVLADFTERQHPRMLGLTGTPKQIRAAAKAYRTIYNKNDPAEEGDEYYLVDHMTFTYLTLPEYGFVEFFRRDTTAEEMADRVACFMEAS